MVHAEVFKPGLPGILEPPDIARAGDAVFVVAVDCDGAACAVGECDDLALVIGKQIAARGCRYAGTFELH